MDLAVVASFGSAAVQSVAHGGAFSWIAGLLQGMIAVAVLVREPERRAATAGQVAAALPSLVAGAILTVTAGSQEWGPGLLALLLVGSLLTLAGLLSLGRSFAVFPAVRTLRTGGVYRRVRHPIYLGECLIAAAAAWKLGVPGLGAWGALVGLVAWRITVEEVLLRGEPGWAAWAARVRWRLVPWVW